MSKKYHLDQIELPEIELPEIEFPSLSSILSLSNGTNLSNAYNFGGIAYTGVLAAASYVDQTLALNGITSKNYVSLSSFWGLVGWSAVKQINSLEKVPTSYKLPLSSVAALTSLGMVILGPDIFAPKTDVSKTLQSIKLTASFFDNTGEIPKLEEKFQEGYFQGVKHSLKNIPQLWSNKFIKSVIQNLGADVVKLFLVQKFFQYMPVGKVAAFFAAKETNPFHYLIKLTFLKLANQVIEIIHGKVTTELNKNIEKDISKKVAELVLTEDNTQKVMDLGNKVNNIATNISTIQTNANLETSKILKNLMTLLIKPQAINNEQPGNILGSKSSLTLYDLDEIYSGKFVDSSLGVENMLIQSVQEEIINDKQSKNIIGSNPSLFLLDSLINTIFSVGNIRWLENMIKTKVFTPESKAIEEDDTDTETVKMGNMTINRKINSCDYTYQNIQEIAKLGGNSFMLNKLLTYFEKAQLGNVTKTNIEIFLDFTKNLIQDCLYTGIFISQNISQEKLFMIEQDLELLMQTLGLKITSASCTQAVDIQDVISTLKILKEPHKGGPERKLSKEMSLSIKDYHLKKVTESSDMLFIENLEFHPGKVYAITGKIGTGKTTILTDIANCLMPVFSSTGTILYPIFKGEAVEEIFCGTVPFSPPATTLFERLTYRVDQDYVPENKQILLQNAIELFESFGQKGFTKEKLLTKGKDDKLALSTGQSKMAMLISAILYKQYLKKPVLFVIDETLANIDEETTNLICTKIKDIFKDSIIISVDHNAKHNTSFYDTFVDLAGFSIAGDDKIILDEDTDMLLGITEDWKGDNDF